MRYLLIIPLCLASIHLFGERAGQRKDWGLMEAIAFNVELGERMAARVGNTFTTPLCERETRHNQ